MKSLTTRLGIEDFPNCTDVRKAGATTLSTMSSKEDMALLSEHMTHSLPTSQKYYRDRSRIEVAKKMHQTIKQEEILQYAQLVMHDTQEHK